MKSTVILLLLMFATLSISAPATSQELVLYYPFEGAGATVTDESGNGNDGEFDTDPAQRVDSLSPRHGTALKFTSTERIVIPESDSLNVEGEISFVMWLKLADEVGGTGTLPRIISRDGDQHELAMDSGHITRGNFAYYFGGNPSWTTGMPVDQEWRHIAVTFDGSEFKIYLDGEEAAQLPSAAAKSFTGSVYIGSRHNGMAEAYAGLLDELAIYAGALDQPKIQEIIDGGVLDQLPVDAAGRLAHVWANLKKR